ncbi:MAG: acetylornithine transaminase [Actinobacteria bacterium]|nr:acetylornithine transaminase [Actinomycetota bacterium]
MCDLDHLQVREAATLMHTYARQPAAFVRGEGAWLYDGDGQAYLDGLSGLAVTGLGHAHPAVTEAVAHQAATLMHTSNLYYTHRQIELAEGLANTFGWSDARTFFCNSGAEANEAAIKLARLHGTRRTDGAVGVVALTGSFHGRTLGALRLTGNPAKHRPFEPLGDWVTHVGYDDDAALEAAVDDQTSAVLVEVVQGEGGVRPVPPDVLRAARAACDRVGALLIVDEVQTGLGRLGSWYGWQSALDGDPVRPDVVCLAKGLANGLPIGAIVAHGEAAKVFEPGDHATTFGGGPVVCAAALAVLGVIERDGLVARAAQLGDHFVAAFDALADGHPLIAGHRGRGLLQAVTLTRPVAPTVVAAALDHGLIVNAVAADAVRFAPPLILSDAELEQLLERFAAALTTVEQEAS